jgi:catechol 2,3-dioxygenase-like lactoylglutathione lyase family enzyme
MRRSVAWYRDMLGFEVVQSHEPDGHLYWAMLRLGDATLMLNAQYEDKRPPGTGATVVAGPWRRYALFRLPGCGRRA